MNSTALGNSGNRDWHRVCVDVLNTTPIKHVAFERRQCSNRTSFLLYALIILPLLSQSADGQVRGTGINSKLHQQSWQDQVRNQRGFMDEQKIRNRILNPINSNQNNRNDQQFIQQQRLLEQQRQLNRRSTKNELFFGDRLRPRVQQPQQQRASSQPRQSVQTSPGPQRIVSPFFDTRPTIVTSKEAAETQLVAEKAFKKRDYAAALAAVNRAMESDVENYRLNMFAAHIEMATGNYKTAASILEATLPTLPIRDWNIVIRDRSLMAEQLGYQQQLADLSLHCDSRPMDIDARFVRSFYEAARGNDKKASWEAAQILFVSKEHKGAKLLHAKLGKNSNIIVNEK